jgi:hypothetical protein
MSLLTPGRTRAGTGTETTLARLRGLPPDEHATLRLSAGARRGLTATARLLREQATAAGCGVALAETGGLAAHWIDGIVWGPAADLAVFVTALPGALDRAAGGARIPLVVAL